MVGGGRQVLRFRRRYAVAIVAAGVGNGCLDTVLYCHERKYARWEQFTHTPQGAERSHFSFLSRHRRQETTGRGRFREAASSMV